MGISNFQGQGANYVPAYQTSGTPFVSSSIAGGVDVGPTRIEFPYVTKVLTIQNLSPTESLRVAFTSSGSYAVGEAVGGSAHTKPKSDSPKFAGYQGNNYFVVPELGVPATGGAGISQVTLDVRCKEVFLMCDHASNTAAYSVYAGLTGISPSEFPTLSGSNGFQGTG